MTEKLRAAVLGAGRWAASAHLPGFVRSPLVDLVAICDRDEALAKQRAREFNIPHVFTDYQAMLSQLDLDVVDVCTRASPTDPDNHEVLTFAILEAGAHCLCEKPVCHDYRRTWEAHELAAFQRIEDEGRPHLPLRACHAIHVRAHRAGRAGRFVHLQRLRAKFTVHLPRQNPSPKPT